MLKTKLKVLLRGVRYFTTTPATSTANPVGQAAPPKTKEELKIEKLMEQWPEHIRNPDPEIFEHRQKKHDLMQTYKYHQGDKPYIKQYDLPDFLREDVLKDTMFAGSTDNIIHEFKDKEGFVPDDLMLRKFLYVCMTHKDLTQEFFSYFVPLVKKIIAKADRHSNKVLAHAAIGAASINLVDNEFWNIIVIYLYIYL
jgi:hypothetical protein